MDVSWKGGKVRVGAEKVDLPFLAAAVSLDARPGRVSGRQRRRFAEALDRRECRMTIAADIDGAEPRRAAREPKRCWPLAQAHWSRFLLLRASRAKTPSNRASPRSISIRGKFPSTRR